MDFVIDPKYDKELADACNALVRWIADQELSDRNACAVMATTIVNIISIYADGNKIEANKDAKRISKFITLGVKDLMGKGGPLEHGRISLLARRSPK